MDKMMMIILVVLILCLFGIAFLSYHKVTDKTDERLIELQKDNKKLLQQNDSIQSKLNLVDSTLYKTRTMVTELKKRDSLLARKQDNIKGKFDNIKDEELQKKFDATYIGATSNNAKGPTDNKNH